jgi:prepilin-type N-terminal cleavage/methylation domain-containing protein
MTDPEETRDAGMSLTELIIAMAIFTIVITVFTGGLMTMARSTARTFEVTDASNSLRTTFQHLDRQIRYASSINSPGVGSSGSWYVEFLTTSVPDGELPICTQWRYDPTAETLAYRTWRDDSSSAVSNWRVVAEDVRNDTASGQDPFVYHRANGVYTRQRLDVAVFVASDPNPGGDVDADISSTFVARNSSFESPSNPDVDADGTSDTFVCTSHLSRP